MALRDIALIVKKWAKSNHMLAGSYPAQPEFDPAVVRDCFGRVGLPYATRVLQDRQISYIGIDELRDAIVIFTKKKMAAKDLRGLQNVGVVDGQQKINIIFQHAGMAEAGNAPIPPAVAPFSLHQNRYTCGSSVYIGSEKGAGTLGCLVRSNADGTLYGLSNNHVTGGSNYAEPGLPILAPGILDVAAGGQDPETIGHHHACFPFIDGIPHVVNAADNLDAALFKIADEDRVSSMQRKNYDTPTNFGPLEIAQNVQKLAGRRG